MRARQSSQYCCLHMQNLFSCLPACVCVRTQVGKLFVLQPPKSFVTSRATAAHTRRDGLLAAKCADLSTSLFCRLRELPHINVPRKILNAELPPGEEPPVEVLASLQQQNQQEPAQNVEPKPMPSEASLTVSHQPAGQLASQQASKKATRHCQPNMQPATATHAPWRHYRPCRTSDRRIPATPDQRNSA